MRMLDQIKKLRDLTGLGVNDCKSALDEAKGNIEQALAVLRKKGVEIAAKKSTKATLQGVIEGYIHFSSSIGALVEINCQTDFVAKTDDFKKFARDIAMHVAACNPAYLTADEIPLELIEQLKNQKEAFIESNCLLDQPFVKDQSMKIRDYLNAVIAKTGEKICIRRFSRFAIGENVE